jgi:dynein-related subfamily AAA family protein
MVFRARYKGTCKDCNQAIEVGQPIRWTRHRGYKGAAYHVDCKEPNREPRVADEVPRETTPSPETPQTDVPEAPGEVDLAKEALDLLGEALGASRKREKPAIDEAKVRALVAEVVGETVCLSVTVKQPSGVEVKIDNAHKDFPTLLHYGSRGKHCYLFGPHGSGKSTGAAQLAKALGRQYGYISLTPQTPESRLLGYLDATGTYRSTPFRKCYENGGVFCIDELDNAAPALITTLNTPLENGATAFPDGLVHKHPDFVLVGTGNTSGRGANPSYPERRPFDQAFADRFIYIEWGYDEKLELAIAVALHQESRPYVKWVQKVRGWAIKNYPRLVPSPRVSFRIAESLAAENDKLSIDTILDCALWRGDADAKDKVLANIPLPSGV